MYTDLSTAGQLSSFTQNPRMVSCGVGTVGLPRFSGPFAMLMYATRIDNYAVDRERRMLRANGRMRSITAMRGETVEDVEHDFIAVAAAGQAPRFDVHFITPFWTPKKNPLATPSSEKNGWSRFGGRLLFGVVKVSSK